MSELLLGHPISVDKKEIVILTKITKKYFPLKKGFFNYDSTAICMELEPVIGHCSFAPGQYLPTWKPNKYPPTSIPKGETLIFRVGEENTRHRGKDSIIITAHDWGFYSEYIEVATQRLPIFKVTVKTPFTLNQVVTGDACLNRLLTTGKLSFLQSLPLSKLSSTIELEIFDNQSLKWEKIPDNKVFNLIRA